jgi:glucose/arabinose dehydrogenase
MSRLSTVTALSSVILMTTSAAIGEPTIRLTPVVEALSQPLFVTESNDDSGRLFIVEKGGLIRILDQGTLHPLPFVDLTTKVTNTSEMGLLGLAFHPGFAQNGRFFVNYATMVDGPRRSVIAEYQVSTGDPNAADPTTERILLTVDQPAGNHNGGVLAFGPDGYLYVGLGDGGGSNDTFGNAQDLSTLLGAILRIDVDQDAPYGIPAGNPFVADPGARDEIWAWGLRNPWRFSFDRLTGQLWAADVGQNRWEEVDLIRKGRNYGWNIMEGSHCFDQTEECDTAGLELPVAEYGHDEGNSVTGGYVYRGEARTPLWGSYVFGDFGTGRIWSLTPRPGNTWKRRLLLDTDLSISSFGEDVQGNLYVVSLGGSVSRMDFGWRTVFAQFADAPVRSGRLRSTLMVVPADAAEPLTGRLRFFDRDGNRPPVDIDGSPASQINFSVPVGEGTRFRSTVSGTDSFVGWVELECDRRCGGTILFSYEDAAGLPVTEAGVASSELASAFRAFAVRESSQLTDTGLALVNPGESSANVSISFREKGQEVASTEIVLGPFGQTARFLHELAAGLSPDFSGTVVVSSDLGIAGTILRTRDGLPLASLPLIPQDE